MNRAELEGKLLKAAGFDSQEQLIMENDSLKHEVRLFRLYSIILGLTAVVLFVMYVIR